MNFRTYFQQYENNFWQWDNDDSVEDQFSTTHNLITLPDKSTISYTAYALEILDALSDNGLPPFGSYLLVLYAASVSESRKIDGLIYFIKSNCEKISKTGDFTIEYADAITFLENIKDLGKDLKKGKNKVLLFTTLFKEAHYKISSEDSKQILDNVQKRFGEYDLSVKNNFSKDVFARDLKVLHLLNRKFPTSKSIINAMFNYMEIEELEEDILEESSDANCKIIKDENLLQNLLENPETFHIGSLIKRIWSGLKVPMHQYLPGLHPLGGFADITNKGNFDRMLLSEFANDNEVFISRIANNEVLYVDREMPPEENRNERIIVIDASIKNWGIPKTLSFSTAIAIAKHPKAEAVCRIFVASVKIQEVALHTVEDVIAGYSVNTNHLNAALVISDFIENLKNNKNTELFLLLSEDSLQSREMQRLIQENKDILRYVITSNTSGMINFFKYQNGKRKHIQKIVLPLGDLWMTKREKTAQKIDHPLFSPNYPILFPVKSNFIADFILDGYQYILTKTKSLIRRKILELHHTEHQIQVSGGEVLFEKISIKNRGDFGLGITTDGEYFLAQYLYNQRQIFLLNLSSNSFFKADLPANFKAHVDLRLVFFENKFYVYHSLENQGLEIYNFEDKVIINEFSTTNKRVNALLEVKKTDYGISSYQNILTNTTSIGINSSNNITIGKHEIFFNDHPLFLSKMSGDQILYFSIREGNMFTFKEGSTIILDKRGLLIFTSHNPEIPTFYMPSAIDNPLGAATDIYYTGNAYYHAIGSDLIHIDESLFFERYIAPFIQNIIDYAAED